MRTTFAVGRLTPRSAEIVLLDDPGKPDPIPGPWKLEALVARLRTRHSQKKKAESRVH